MAKFYLSNIRSQWPIERQEALLDERAPGWREESVYRDQLSAAKRKAHGPGDLTQRVTMLRPTRRGSGETVTVASLAVLDWSPRGLLAVLTALSERSATLVSLDCGTVVPPNDAKAIEAAVGEFERAVRRVGSAQKRGGDVSGERRAAIAKAGVDRIKERWKLPSKDHPTTALLAEAGVSRPTAIQYLGKRQHAQWMHERAIETAERNRARRKKANGD